jgi:superfamily II DNA/RNA helicase
MDTLLTSVGSDAPLDMPFVRLHHSCSAVSLNRPIEEIEAFLRDPSLRIRVLGVDNPPPIFSFAEADLPREVMDIIHSNNWVDPTPIQMIALPIILAGRDMIGIAKTGSGKTAAFAIPAVLHCLENRGNPTPQVLVLAPVRELAQQTEVVMRSLAESVGLRTICIFGGEGSRNTQIRACGTRPQIVIGTPGRLLDLVDNKTLDLSSVSFVVVDEADDMLRQGFQRQCRALLDRCQRQRQTLMWSATWPKAVRELAKDYLAASHLQVVAGASERTVNPNIEQLIVRIADRRPNFMHLAGEIQKVLMESDNRAKMIVFANSCKRVRETAQRLGDEGTLRVHAIYGEMTQGERNGALNAFRVAQPPCCLVATSVAERGMNFDDVTHVVIFEMPDDIDDYVHRIGRTARASQHGKSVALFSVDQDAPIAKKLVKVLKQGMQPVPEWLEGLAEETGGDSYRNRRSRY